MQFTLGISGDLLTNDGNPCFGEEPLRLLYKEKKILCEWMEPSIQVLSEKETSKYDAILLNSPKLTKDSINPKINKLKIVSRFGVGYDSVDLDILKDNAIGIMLEKPLTEEQADKLANVLRKTIPDHDLEVSM